jgi:hypothetical protein
MELNFTEISDAVHNNETEPKKYWENQKTNETPSKNLKSKKKKVSFDDILSNMNLVVNQNGTLQHMSSNPESIGIQSSHNNIEQYSTNYNQNNISNHNSIQVHKQEPLDPNVKHSYIYNKYFKDYNDINDTGPEIRVPKTMEEYKRMLLEDRIKAIEQRKRIAEIKSKKLLFTTNVSSQRGIPISNNSLRSMKFN